LVSLSPCAESKFPTNLATIGVATIWAILTTSGAIKMAGSSPMRVVLRERLIKYYSFTTQHGKKNNNRKTTI
jgi:hypothetical protein